MTLERHRGQHPWPPYIPNGGVSASRRAAAAGLHRGPWLLLGILAALLLGAPAVASPEAPTLAGDRGIHQPLAYTLMVGFPDADGSEAPRALVVPGAVIPLGAPPEARDAAADEDGAGELSRTAERLRKTVRLDRVEVLYQQLETQKVGDTHELPRPSDAPDIRVQSTLLGSTKELVNLRVRMHQGEKALADTTLAVPLGEQAVVGALDGEAAPYLFLLVEARAAEGYWVDVKAPVAIERSVPRYTPEAKAEGIEGVVIVQAKIDETGTVQDVKVLEGLPFGLDQAAMDAVRRWRFEPAEDQAGKPIAVFYNLTLNFTLRNR